MQFLTLHFLLIALPFSSHPLEQHRRRLVVPPLAPGELGLRRHELAAERLREHRLPKRPHAIANDEAGSRNKLGPIDPSDLLAFNGPTFTLLSMQSKPSLHRKKWRKE